MSRSLAGLGAVALLLLAAGYCCVGPGSPFGTVESRQLRAYTEWRFQGVQQHEQRQQPRRWLQEGDSSANSSEPAQPPQPPAPPSPPSPLQPRLDLRERLGGLLGSASEVHWAVAWEEVEPAAEPSNVTEAAPPPGQPPSDLPPPPPPLPLTDTELLMACLNRDNELLNSTSWSSATASDSVGSSLRAVASFTFNRTHAALAAGVDPASVDNGRPVTTLVTASSIDRLQQLHAQCRAWSGALSAVLFMGLLQEGHTGPQGRTPLLGHNMAALQEALMQVAHFMMDMRSAPHACKPTVLLMYEIYSDRESMLLYPVNLLRNIARIQAQTPLVAMLDVDLLPSKTLANRLVTHEGSAQLLLSKVQQDKAVYIVPAFEPAPEFETASWAEALASSPSKEIMVMAMDKGIVTPFHFSRWAVGHQVTNFSHWHDGSNDYDVKYQMHCEPWLVGDRVAMPWHDVRYRGFGFNKMQHVLNLAHDKWQFRVLGDSYCIHRPHKVVDAKGLFIMRTVTHQGMTSLRQHVEAMYNKQVETGTSSTPRPFVAPVSAPEERCRGVLPWWAEAERQLKLKRQQEEQRLLQLQQEQEQQKEEEEAAAAAARSRQTVLRRRL